MHRQAPLKASAGGASIHDMALQLLQYYPPAGKTASLAVQPRFGSLYYQAENVNPKKRYLQHPYWRTDETEREYEDILQLTLHWRHLTPPHKIRPRKQQFSSLGQKQHAMYTVHQDQLDPLGDV